VICEVKKTWREKTWRIQKKGKKHGGSEEENSCEATFMLERLWQRGEGYEIKMARI